jgi:acetyl esterase/lipase
LLTILLSCGVVACGADTSGSAASPVPTPEAGEEVLPGVTAVVTRSAGSPSGVVVALVPGGGWVSADPSGLAPLAGELAASGAVAVRLTYRTATDGVYFPDPLQDIGCGIAFAATQALSAPDGAGPTVAVVGHSAGAVLAAVAALDPEAATGPDCPYPPAEPDLLVGLAGPYDVVAVADLAVSLFGPDNPDPDDWAAGNPVALAGLRPDLPVLLVHGTDDPLVPVSFSEQFAEALRQGGHPVDLQTLDGVDHDTVYRADNAGPVITDWVSRTAQP